MSERGYTEIEIIESLFNIEGETPFCFIKAYTLIRNLVAFINKLGLKGEFLLESHELERDDYEVLFTIEKNNPCKKIRERVDKVMEGIFK